MRQERTQRERRFRLRWRENLALGVGLGLILGVGLGALLGVIAFEPGSRGMWGSILAGALFGVVLGAFEAGMASLESPQPGKEPVQAEHPVRDVSDLTDTERDVRIRDVTTDPEIARLTGPAADQLRREGVSEDELRRLADRYLAEGRGRDVEGFVAWARIEVREPGRAAEG